MPLLYTTEIKAINPKTGEICIWAGPYVPGLSFSDAADYCQANGLGYCDVVGEFIMDAPFVEVDPELN